LIGDVDDAELHALLSFAPLCSRNPVIDFLTSMAGDITEDHRQHVVNVVIGLFRISGQPRPSSALDEYAHQW
jgi:hypothetical protein